MFDKSGDAQIAAATFYQSHTGEKFDAKDKDHLNKLAEIEGVHAALGMPISEKTLTEGRLKTLQNSVFAFNVNGAEREEMLKRQTAFEKYNKSLLDGTTVAEDVLAMHGITGDKEINEQLNKFLKCDCIKVIYTDIPVRFLLF